MDGNQGNQGTKRGGGIKEHDVDLGPGEVRRGCFCFEGKCDPEGRGGEVTRSDECDLI
jgi:hypothetical protein